MHGARVRFLYLPFSFAMGHLIGLLTRVGGRHRACYAEPMYLSKTARVLAVAAARVGWAGLALQFFLMVGHMGAAGALWRFLGFYTILTNIGAATVATAVALRHENVLVSGRARLLVATSIIMVGIVYSVALRTLWSPTGLQKIADVLLHDAAPLVWALFWVVGPHVGRVWREVAWALFPPLAYCIYALARGGLDGWYAYWFLDPATQSPVELASSIFILLLAFSVLAVLLVAVDQSLASLGKRPARHPVRIELVDEVGEGSFPASDPPPWTLGDERKREPTS